MVTSQKWKTTWATDGLETGYKQKWPTEVSHCCYGKPRIDWLREKDLNFGL